MARYRLHIVLALFLSSALIWQIPSRAQQGTAVPRPAEYTDAQARLGRAAYEQNCASCHGTSLDNGAFAPALKGPMFSAKHRAETLDALYSVMTTTMPPANPGGLGRDAYVLLLAFILQSNDVAAGTRELPGELRLLTSMTWPNQGGPAGASAATASSAPARPTRLDNLSPLTDRDLASPPPGDWLTWRRTRDAHGFSPLTQINKGNVGSLRSVWSWSLPVGTSESIPLVHDGVMFVFGSGDRMQALDAATGDLLWQYSGPPPAYKGPRGAEAPGVRRSIAIHGNKVYFGTNDVHLVALDTKTGRVVWDQAIGDPAVREGIAGGPLVARGKVMIGTTGTLTGAKPGGPKIVGLDAETGKLAWQVNTIAHPGEPGGNSWNGVPIEKRTGASVWTTGSYDERLGLAFFGTANTYDTLPVTEPSGQPGVTSELLYTNSTLAIDPDSGRLVWYFQHHANDLWDMDWAFEQIVVSLPANGGRTSIVTAGKLAIYDAVDAESGKYQFSVDSGLQNLVTAIDPATGAKRVNPDMIPRNGQPIVFCPSTAGAKNWLPASYNATTRTVFVALVEACTDLRPSPRGPGTGALTSGYGFTSRPRPDSDGKFGRIQAINLETRKTLWTSRQRAPYTSGVLATAGGLIFAGSLDRYLRAYDDATGEVLWETRLNDVLSAPPITYSVDGKQYVAIVAGRGGFQVAHHATLVPEIKNPTDATSSLWVFQVPASATR